MESPSDRGIIVAPGADKRLALPAFLPKKVIADLQEGYRVTFKNTPEEYISDVVVVTRLDSQVFAVKTGYSVQRALIPPFYRYNCEVRRREPMPHPLPGSSTLEKWNARASSNLALFLDYRTQAENGGELDETEFWRRYNLSAVDPDFTDVQLALYLAELTPKWRAQAKVAKISEENAHILKDPRIIE